MAGIEEKEVIETLRPWFKDNFGITYPVIPDFDFTIMDVIGNPGGTPFLVLFPVGGAPGAGPPARAHMGLMRDPDRFVAEIEAALALEAVSEEAGVIRLTSWRNLEPELSDSDLEARLRASGEEVGLNAEKIEAVSLPGEKFFYRLSDTGGKWLWAKVSGRSRICNICHDIFFIILFDDEGKIVNFSPILVTKYDNVPIDEKDTAFMKKRVIGRYLSEEIDFDPSVDSISTATMSSELIFDTLRRLRKAYETLKKR